jgi:N-hydroxyarylamine O-acetyltransferase
MAVTLDLDAYLQRIDYRGDIEPTLEVLRALHLAHATHIPFENIDVLLGRPVALDLASLEAKLVKNSRGGYCFEQNTLFAAVLERIGFAVTTLAARVRHARTQISPRTHMLLLVVVEKKPYLADVGFGSAGFIEPLALESNRTVEQFGWLHRLEQDGAGWILQTRIGSEWVDQYYFMLEPQYPIDYEVANYYTSTFPTSIFRLIPLVQFQSTTKRLMLRNSTVIETRNSDSVASYKTIEESELLAVLAEQFGLRLPPGTRIPVAAVQT